MALVPIGWRAGWWHFRFSLLTLMPWAAYFGLAAVIVSVLALVIGLSRLDRRGIALALVALIGGGLIAYVPWHYDQIRQTVPPIHDIASDKPAGRIEASQRSRWMGFTDDIIVRVTPASSGSRIDLRSSSRYGRSDFGVNAARIRDYLTALRAATTSQG